MNAEQHSFRPPGRSEQPCCELDLGHVPQEAAQHAPSADRTPAEQRRSCDSADGTRRPLPIGSELRVLHAARNVELPWHYTAHVEGVGTRAAGLKDLGRAAAQSTSGQLGAAPCALSGARPAGVGTARAVGRADAFSAQRLIEHAAIIGWEDAGLFFLVDLGRAAEPPTSWQHRAASLGGCTRARPAGGGAAHAIGRAEASGTQGLW